MKLTETSDLKILLTMIGLNYTLDYTSLSHKVLTSHPVDKIRDIDWGYTDRHNWLKELKLK